MMAGNNSDGIVNVPKKEFVRIVVEAKPNQGINAKWAEKQLKELVLLGTVKNVKQVSPTEIEMTIKSEMKDLVRTALTGTLEVFKFYEVE
jgi:hypothetical protein